MAKRGRKALMRVEGTCESDRGYHSNNGKFSMTITRDGMAGYGYCDDGHWNIKFLKPADELMYLYLTKHKLTGGSLTGIETKLLFEAFQRWATLKKIQINVSYRRGGNIEVTLPPKIEFSKEKDLFPDFSNAFSSNRQFRDATMIQDLQRILSAHSKLFETRTFSVSTIQDIIGAVQQIKEYLNVETSNKDDIIKEFNVRILNHNESILKKMRDYARQHYGVQ